MTRSLITVTSRRAALASLTLDIWCRDLRGWSEVFALEEVTIALAAVDRIAQKLAEAVQFGVCDLARALVRLFNQGVEGVLEFREVRHGSAALKATAGS